MICGFQKITKNKIVEVKMNGKYFNSLGFSLTKRLFFGLFICCLALDFVFAQVKPPESKIIYQQGEKSVSPVEELSSVPKSITLSPPVMVYPPNNATNVAIVPKFHHKSVVGANRYDLQVATDSSFYSIISYSYWRFLEADTSIRDIKWFPGINSPQDFRNNTVYYWRVRAFNTQTGETSNWSSPFRYTTTSPGASLVQPSLVAPANSATTGWLNVKLEWSQVANATWYQVQWSIDNTFDGFTYSNTPGTSPQYIIANLEPMKTYYWRVVAFNDNSISAFSTTYSFQTGNMVTLTDSVGTFDDGSGIDNYENNLDIYWLIKPPNAQRIILSFQSFDTESGYDFVTIYDGETTSAPILGRFSGSSIPSTIISSGGAMLVRFETDGSITEKGWVARYRAVYAGEPQFNWVSRAPMPTPRSWAPAVVEGRKIYVVGGCSSPVPQQYYNAVATLEVYDPATNTWQQLAPMSMPRVGPAVAALNGKIYVFGGFNRNTWSANSSVEIYNIATNRWTTGASMPTPRSWARAVVLDNKIYVLGGVGYGYRGDVEVYDPATNTWETKASFSRERYLHAAVAYNGKIYIIGGDSWEQGYNEVWDDIQEYDPSTNTWTRKTPMPSPANGLDAVAVNGKIYVLGGLGVVRVYDIATDRWEEIPSNHTSNGSLSVAFWNGYIYRLGGGGWGPTISTVEACDISGVTGVSGGGDIIPKEFALYQNYPNPFNPATTIEFDLPERSNVKLVVYDVLGREVEKLVDEELDAGRYKVNFNASNLPSGVYFYRIVSGKFVDTKKMMYLK